MLRRVIDAWAEGAARFCEVLRAHDPDRRPHCFELAGGYVVLTGAFVNRAMAVGVDRPMTADEFDALDAASEASGTPPSIEVTPATHAGTRALASRRGYVVELSLSALRHTAPEATADRSRGAVVVEPAADRLALWQRVAAEAWGYESEALRQASDAFAVASVAVDPDSLLLALDGVDRRPLGCARLARSDGVATLGGMSTLADERGRGVQSALIVDRVRRAADAGCDVITSTTAAGSASERNLLRHGFERWFAVEVMTRR